MSCTERTLDFIVKEDDPEAVVVEDDIREDLAKIGITVNTMALDADAYSEAERDGSYHMLLAKTWGAPYDPHTYLNSWAVPAHVEFSALGNLEAPLTRESLLQKINDVQRETDDNVIRESWKEILNDVHQQAIFLPLWGARIPYVINRRLDNYVPAAQAFTYPLQSVTIASGPSTVTVAPGSGGSLFTTVGPMHPHLYAPNQLFVSDWMYEGLVAYGQDGIIVPALASSWTIEDTAEGQQFTFELRQNVTFHDDTAWNCTVAKLNFDHILSPIVRERHGWFEASSVLKSWTCNAAGDFVLETNSTFYPLLQELTYVRPLRFASASSFSQGADSDADTQNSCIPGGFGSSFEHLEDAVECLGLTAPIGTGPFKFVSREFLEGSEETCTGTPDDECVDASVTFARHEGYWGTLPAIETLIIQHYETTDDVYAALESGDLDMVLGTGPLTPMQVRDIQRLNSTTFDVERSTVFQNALLVLNANKDPVDDINVRKAIVHAINKAEFIDQEFAGLEQPINQLLPLTAPFSDIDLNPKWDFDLEKAQLLNCPDDSSSLSKGAIAGISVGAVALAALIALVCCMVYREKKGKPLFEAVDKYVDGTLEKTEEQ